MALTHRPRTPTLAPPVPPAPSPSVWTNHVTATAPPSGLHTPLSIGRPSILARPKDDFPLSIARPNTPILRPKVNFPLLIARPKVPIPQIVPAGQTVRFPPFGLRRPTGPIHLGIDRRPIPQGRNKMGIHRLGITEGFRRFGRIVRGCIHLGIGKRGPIHLGIDRMGPIHRRVHHSMHCPCVWVSHVTTITITRRPSYELRGKICY